MRFNGLRDLRGVLLIMTAAVAAVWLAATGQLNLYIHPRYIVFTVIFAAIALAIIVFGTKHDYDHSQDSSTEVLSVPPSGVWKAAHIIARQAGLMVCAFGVLALLISKPLPLTSDTANQRGINSSVAGSSANQLKSSPLFAGSDDYSAFTIKDWTSLLAQTDDPEYFEGKKASVVGFVVADQSDKDVFYVSRFLVTCCAVDGRAIGLAVYAPGWRNQFKEDDWVDLSGTFVPNPSALNADPVAIKPEKMQQVPQPEVVYVY